MKKIIIYVIALILLGVSTFGGVYLYTSQNAEKEEVIKESFFELDEIFVNLNDKPEKRYVKLNVSISYDVKNKDLAKEVEEKKVVLRDTAIFYLKSCVADNFNAENESKLKKDLVTAMNQNLTSGTLVDVYVSDIIVQ